MKTCETCGDEIGTKDGDNYCPECEHGKRSEAKKARARKNRKARESVLRDLGMVKVHGALGGTYWE